MTRLRDLIPTSLRPAARSAYHAAFRSWLSAEWRLRDLLERDPALPPAKLRFRVGESSDPAVFKEVGRRTAENVVSCLDRAGRPLSGVGEALDFGCGCGRTLAWLTRHYPAIRWYGADVDAEAIEWCSGHLPGAFVANAPMPPSPFPDAQFDLVFGVSVFTHLDENHQRAWAPELHRILRPGGILLLSFYSEQVWKTLAEAAAVEDGAFVFRTSTKLKGIVPDWYQTAFQNQRRIEELLRSHFRTLQFQPRGFGDHDAAVAIK